MSQGHAYRCDNCGTMRFTPNGNDKLGRHARPPVGWLAVVEIVEAPERDAIEAVGPERHFCSRPCLLNWIWEESK